MARRPGTWPARRWLGPDGGGLGDPKHAHAWAPLGGAVGPDAGAHPAAEGGAERPRKLTGVQEHATQGGVVTALWIGIGLATVLAGSEERRVGKECRSRWSPY